MSPQPQQLQQSSVCPSHAPALSQLRLPRPQHACCCLGSALSAVLTCVLLLGVHSVCCPDFFLDPSCRRAGTDSRSPQASRTRLLHNFHWVFWNLTPRAAWDFWFLATPAKGARLSPNLLSSTSPCSSSPLPSGEPKSVVVCAKYVAAILSFFFFPFPVLGMEARAVGGHPDNCSALSPVPIVLFLFIERL